MANEPSAAYDEVAGRIQPRVPPCGCWSRRSGPHGARGRRFGEGCPVARLRPGSGRATAGQPGRTRDGCRCVGGDAAVRAPARSRRSSRNQLSARGCTGPDVPGSALRRCRLPHGAHGHPWASSNAGVGSGRSSGGRLVRLLDRASLLRGHVAIVSDYLREHRYRKRVPPEWLPTHAYHRPLGMYVNELARVGFRIERLVEAHHPAADASGVPALLTSEPSRGNRRLARTLA